MLVKDVMTRTPAFCKPSDTLDDVARLMLEFECGEIPICDGTNLVGVITDRDIICRVVATGRSPFEVPVGDVMTRSVYSIGKNEKVSAAVRLFEETLVRRLPVVDSDGRLVGIISQADLATKLPSFRIARLLKSAAKRTRRQLFAATA
jgi:CBS domain-containing protein